MWLAMGLVCLLAPVPGQQVAAYAPQGAYAGHWGVDLAADPGSAVAAPLDGEVTFAGSVAGTATVTIRQGPYKVSVSYLSEISVAAGSRVTRGTVVGRSGTAHGERAVHLSVRLDDTYVDPDPFLQCRFGSVSEALRLVPYPEASANRNPGRHLRSAASRSPAHRRSGIPPTGPRHGRLHARRGALAKGGKKSVGRPPPLGDDPPRRRRRRLLRGRRA